MALVCEVCGSTEIKKSNGIFVCGDCGCQYSLEDVKALAGKGNNATIPSSQVSKTSDEGRIKNMLDNAMNTYKAGNYSVAFNQFNDVLNLQPDHFSALLYKGISAGMQSSVSHCRLSEASSYVTQAIKTQFGKDDDEMTQLTYFVFCSLALREIMSLGDLCITMFGNYLKDECNYLSSRLKNLSGFSYEYQIKENNRIQTEISNVKSLYIRNLDMCVIETLNPGVVLLTEILRKRNFSKINYDLANIIKRNGESLLKVAQGTKARECCHTVIDSATSFERTHKKLIAEKEAAEKTAIIEKYWKEHPNEKSALDNELKDLENKKVSLSNQIGQINNQINNYKNKKNLSLEPLEKIRLCLREEITELTKDFNRLGMFKSKEKKALQNKIDTKNSELEKIREQIEIETKNYQESIEPKISELNKQISVLNFERTKLDNRINEIKYELTKDRRTK